MKAFDIFVKPAKETNSSTVCGGWLTLIATICAGLLISSQIMNFRDEVVSKDWKVDYHKTTDTLDVHIDIILPNAPCRILSMDVLDFVGSEMHDVDLNHIRIDKNGKYEGHTSEHAIDKTQKIEQAEIAKEVDLWPGCQINGVFPIRKAPGNFHISFHSYFNFYEYLVNRANKNINLEYQIHSLQLETKGDHHMNVHAMKKYRDRHDKDFYIKAGNQAVHSLKDGTDKKGRFVAEHFLNIYPVMLDDKVENETFEFHEYTFTRKFKPMNDKEKMMPLLEFKTKFLPFQNVVTVHEGKISTLVLNIFAICGGVFAIFSLIEALLGPGLKYLVDLIM